MIAAMDPNPPVAGLHLVLGGARSGKSAYAQALAAAQEAAGREICVVATALAADAEMRARIARHRADRPAHWRLVEPSATRHALAEAIDAHADARRCLLVDCLTLWLSQAIASASAWRVADGSTSRQCAGRSARWRAMRTRISSSAPSAVATTQTSRPAVSCAAASDCA